MSVGQRRREAVVGRAGQVDEVAVAPPGVGRTGAAGHDVAVAVYGIHRVGEGDDVVQAEDLLDVSAVLLRSVGDENLVGVDCDTP